VTSLLWLVALATYLGSSCLLFGINVLTAPSKTSVGFGDDPASFAWFVAWWPHAIGSLQNPLILNAVFAPDGVPAAWATSIPALSLLAAPLTVLTGPVAATNALFILAPALSAFAAFLLCTEITQRPAPALVGGWLYGFSAFISSHMFGHLNLSFAAWIPLLALICIRVGRGKTSIYRGAIAFAVIGALQLGTSTEMALQTAIFGAIALAAFTVLTPELRPSIRRILKVAIPGWIGAAVLISPLLVQQLLAGSIDWHPARRADSQDLLSLVIPDPSLVIHFGDAITTSFTSSLTERGAYISIFGVALFAAFAWSARRHRIHRVLPVLAGIAFVFALGPLLHVAGSQLPLPLPAAIFIPVPILELMITGRFGLFMALCLAVTAAIAIANVNMRRWALPIALLAAIACLPNPTFFLRWSEARTPGSLAAGTASPVANERIISLPVGTGMRWQAVNGFTYTQAGGYTGVILPMGYREWRDVLDGLAGRDQLPSPDRFASYAQEFGATTVVVGPNALPGTDEMLTAAGYTATPADGITIWRRPR